MHLIRNLINPPIYIWTDSKLSRVRKHLQEIHPNTDKQLVKGNFTDLKVNNIYLYHFQ